jgi:predicted amidophosphoribosyltransferase
MAEFCPSCSEKYGLEKENDFNLCEGCGKTFNKVEKD